MGRKKPFSGKAKKEQLLERRRRQKKYERVPVEENKAVSQSHRSKDLKTIFIPETRERIRERKKDATRILDKSTKSPYCNGLGTLEMELGMPKRPKWSRSMTPEALEAKELEMYEEWLDQIASTYSSDELNYFEQNLQVWRQLWRTIEKSDIIVLVVDARFPILHFSMALYQYVTQDHDKSMVLCINKTDLISSERLDRWCHYFTTSYPKLQLATLNRNDPSTDALLQAIGECSVLRGGKRISAAPFVQGKGPVDAHLDREQHITVGITGDPNMGKSTLINRIFEKKVVSESATPGHTKHFQTMFLLPTLCFCDCPGVVFPKLQVDREIQVLFGSFPIAQTREPYSAIRYLAEHCDIPLHKVYKLTPIDEYADDITEDTESYEWSPYSLVEAFAKKKRYCVRGGKFDVYRAANQILRDALRGDKVILSFDPPTELPEQITPQKSEAELVHDILSNSSSDEEEYQGSSSEEEEEAGHRTAFLDLAEDSDSSDD